MIQTGVFLEKGTVEVDFIAYFKLGRTKGKPTRDIINLQEILRK